ncbi:MAG: 2,3,4,5-tetrahydropyridine-2,6-dicarboxylate N-succinyltransferase [Ornithinimicrobium sp.]
MSTATLPLNALDDFFSRPLDEITADPGAVPAVEHALQELEAGRIRAALPQPDGTWLAQPWVKHVVLSAFALSTLVDLPDWPGGAVDKSMVPARRFTSADGVRVVPGGSSVRRGAHVSAGVVMMPPSYVNVGAYVAAGSMIDSHVLVGSCAQVGTGVHLSAAAQLGGVLEPIGARPVVVEDDAFIGAQCGLFEGVVVRARAVLAPAVTLTATTTMYDLVHGRTVVGEVPSGAVVVPGSRPAAGDFAHKHGLSLYAPCIVKYRDERTSAAVVLEDALR